MWVIEERKDWLTRSLDGSLHNKDDLENLKESFILNGLGFICLRYMNDNAVLITGEDDMDLTKVVEENKAWLETIFEFVTHWEENLYLSN